MSEEELTEKHTHLEIHPSLILGICSAVSPFAEHNSSPRVPMTSQFIKQALGIHAYNFNLRMDTQSHILYYPQTAIVQTKYADIVGINNKAAGQNFVIAIIPFYGYNSNDAVIVNKSSIERGLARTIYQAEEE